MKNEQVLYAVDQLDQLCALIEWVRREHFAESKTLSVAQRRWYANRDVAVAWHLVRACFDAGQQLPKEISWPAARRGYRCLEAPTETRRTDPICMEVLALGDPVNRQEQAIWNGYLCCQLSYEEIASLFGRSVEFVRLYANLFCDFPERRSAREFVSVALDPRGERGCLQSDLAHLLEIADPSLRNMNIGFRYGPEVLALVVDQALDGNLVPSEADLLKEVRRWLLVGARAKALVGELSSKDPEFDLVKVLSQQEAKANSKYPHQTQDERMGFARISASESCQMVIRKMTEQGALERMDLALQYDAQQAAAKKDVTKADPVVGVGDKDSLSNGKA